MTKLQSLRCVLAVCVFCVALAIASQAQTFTTLWNFDGNNGAQPGFGPLTQGTDGNLYGTTKAGGIYNLGTVFKMTPAGTLTTIYTFCFQNRCPDGAQPEAGLLLGTDGNFYGTTYSGGTLGQGTVFKITPSGVLTVLHSFNIRDGANPYARLVQGADGNFYGTALGGTHGNGTIFKITYGGRLTMLHSFNSSDGHPLDPLLQAPDGNFYGTTYGGAEDYGRIFKMTPSGTVSTLYSFCSEVGCTDGTAPSAGLVLGNDGNFYGTTQFNGATGYGTVFKVTPGGTLTTLHTFDASDGADPYATMIQATDGNLYGTTAVWGANNYGTIFQITPSGTFTTLYNFCSVSGCDDGKSPVRSFYWVPTATCTAKPQVAGPMAAVRFSA